MITETLLMTALKGAVSGASSYTIKELLSSVKHWLQTKYGKNHLK